MPARHPWRRAFTRCLSARIFPGSLRFWVTASVVLTLATVQLFWILTTDFHEFFPDDSFISLRYAQRLLDGQGLTWTDGERVEGYSNLLFVLLTAAGGWVFGHLAVVPRVLGALAVASVVPALFRAFRPSRMSLLLAPLVAGLFLVLSGPIQAWSVAGLEQGLVVGALGWALCLGYPLLECDHPRARQWLPLSAALAALVLTRPDGILFTAAAGFGLLLARRLRPPAWALAVKLASVPAAAMLAQLVFRRLYYQEWVPNTYYAKVAFTSTRLEQGWVYLADGLEANRVLLAAVILSLVAAFFDETARRRLAYAGALFAVWAAYVFVIGGDIFPHHRHLVPLICALCVMSAEGVRVIASLGRLAVPAVAVAAAVALLAYHRDNRRDDGRRAARDDTWHLSGLETGIMLRAAFEQQRPLLAVDAAGAMPYYYRLPVIDMLGLNDRHIAHHRPKDIGNGFIGHELGDGAYVMSRKPDIIAFHNPLGRVQPMWRGGWEMFNDPQFAKLYKLIKFKTRIPREFFADFYMRLDGRVGITRTSDDVRIPGYLFHKTKTVAQFGYAGTMILEIAPGGSGELASIPLEPGRWIVRVDASQPVRVSVIRKASNVVEGLSSAPLELDVTPNAPVTIAVRPSGGDAVALSEINLTRAR
ncbi:MAG TPA: hypothetical protein PLI95_20540 [Polyangiaceae bacterium]|nr:hypothetical protein [Polyangiaceae bacterium]